jgi:aspartate racemase
LRKLGLIGGMSWFSTRTYYEYINRRVQRASPRLSSAPMLIESLDFAQLHGLKEEADWDRAAQILGDSARSLEAAGAGALIIAANSMHRVYDKVAGAVSVPVLHIADCRCRQRRPDRHAQRHDRKLLSPAARRAWR